jgi:hypothetical protein
MNPLTRFRKITILRFVSVGLLCPSALLVIRYAATGRRADKADESKREPGKRTPNQPTAIRA